MHIKQISKGTKGHIIKMKTILQSPSYLSTKVTTITSSLYLSRDAYTNTHINLKTYKK